MDLSSIANALRALAVAIVAAHIGAGASIALTPHTGSTRPELDAPDRLSLSVRDYLRRAEASGFSGAVSLIAGGETVLSRGYGLTGCHDGSQVTADTQFYIASLSKAFTAAAILNLEEEGHIDLLDSIAVHLANVPEGRQSITIEHLLTHRSGIGQPRRDFDAPPRDRDDFVAAALAEPLRHEPGAQRSYSNAGYSLLAAIIERASGHSFEHYLRTHVIAPAGLQHTRLVSEHGHADANADDMAQACNGTTEQGDAALTHHQPFDWSEFGAVGVISTANDLSRWVRAVEAGQLFPDHIADRFFGFEIDGYGFGWVHTRRESGRTLVWHTGQLLPEGWNAQVRIYPESDATLVVLSNRHADEPLGWVVARALDRLIEGGEIAFPPPLAEWNSDAAAQNPAGYYRLNELSGFDLVEHGSTLYLAPVGQEAANYLLGIESTAMPFLDNANERTDRFLTRVARSGARAMPEAISGRPQSDWIDDFEATWQWMVSAFGAFERFQVLHSVPAPFGEDAALTYVRLDFANQSTTVRLVWIGGVFQGMSDRGAFIGATPEVAVIPAPLRLTRTGATHLMGYRLASGEAIEIEILPRERDCERLRILGPAGETAASRGECGVSSDG